METTLLIMAAGIGSRFGGGIKQLEPVDSSNHIIMAEGKMDVKVLRTNDTWYGMTYKEDVMAVRDSFKEMFEKGIYKADLFSDL